MSCRNKDRLHAQARPQRIANKLILVSKLRSRADAIFRLIAIAAEKRFRAPHGRAIEHEPQVRRYPDPPRMRSPMPVYEN